MRDIKHHFLAMVALLLPLACSSSAPESGHDAGGGGSEAGATIDSRSPDASTTEAGRFTDARDAKPADVPALDQGGAVDVSTGVDSGRDAADARDAADTRDAADVRDGSNDRIDAPAPIDAGSIDSGSAIDVAIDTGPVGAGTCASPFLVPRTSLHYDQLISTAGAPRVFKIPCANNTADVVFKLEIDAPMMLVYADTLGATWNSALFFSDTCDVPTPASDLGIAACNDDACGTSQSQLVGVLTYGVHYLIVSGLNGESGDVTVHIEHAVVGSANPIPLAPDATSVQGTTTKGGDATNLCVAAGPQQNYWWLTCPDYAGGTFQATTCGGATWRTTLSLQIPRAPLVDCTYDDPTCGQQSTIKDTVPPGAGINVFTIAGLTQTEYGAYTITYTRP